LILLKLEWLIYKESMPKSWRYWTIFYLLMIVVYVVFSYALTAPNLILSSNALYWKFQTWMWEIFFNDRQLLSWSYGIIMGLLVVAWGGLSYSLFKNQKISQLPKGWMVLLILAVPLLLANNALSYDVFNYIFNAKMVCVYQADPHVQVALNFAQDDWTRFMHNTHTPAPYGYGWTVLSLIPYLLGMGKFLLVWLSFSFFSLVSLGLTFWIIKELHQKIYKKPAPLWKMSLALFNPLVLVEIIGNSHNDLWMMLPVLVAFYLLLQKSKSGLQKISQVVVSLFLLGFSISTKLASILLIPIWGVILLEKPLSKFKWNNFKWDKFVTQNWPLWASGLMFAPLLISRSQQFHPWYLTWSLVFWPLIGEKTMIGFGKLKFNLARLWKIWLIALVVSSVFRYLPYLSAGTFQGNVLMQQKLITWVGGVVLGIIFFLKLALLNFQKKN
jgi:hypothetical protein